MRPRSSSRRHRLATAGLAVLLLAAGGLSTLALRAPASDAAKATPRTSTVQLGSLQSTVGATGNVQAASAWTVGFEAAGKVTSLLARVGDTVQVGGGLATQDPTSAQAAMTQAQDALGTAQTRLAEAQAAVATATNATAATDAVLADADTVNAATTKVAQAQAALDLTTLRSPAAGTVTAVNGVVGQQVSASGVSSAATSTAAASSSAGTGTSGSTGSSSGALFTITDLSSLQVKASLAEADSTKVKPGQPVALSFDALPDVKLAGRVASLALTATVSSNVVSYDTVVSLVNPPPTVRSGMTASATITTASRDGVLRVPTAAVRGSGAASTVSVLNGDGSQTTRRIVVGMRGDDAVEVVSGLVAGDKVVTSSGVTTATTANRTGATRPGTGGLGGGGVGGPPGAAGGPRG